MSPNRSERGWVLGLFALITTILLLWAPPLAWWKDSGQLVSASWGLGVPHPSGFPLYMMMGKGLSFLPIGSIFFRIQALSALSGGLVLAFTGWWLLQVFPERKAAGMAAVVGAISLLTAHLFVLHGTTPEVYMPTLAALTGSFAAVVAYHHTGEKTFLLWAGGGAALSVGLHFSVAVVSLAPLFLWALWSVRKKNAPWTCCIAPVCIGLAGLIAYAYLPVAAGNDPWRNWGAPATLARTWDHLSAASIRAAFDGSMLSATLASNLFQLSAHCSAIWESIGPLAGVGLTMGMWSAFREGPLQFSCRVLLSIALVDTLYTVWINPMGIEDRQTGLHTVWALVALSTLAAGKLVQRSPSGRAALGAGGLFLGLILAHTVPDEHPITLDRSGIQSPERLTDRGLHQAPAGGILLAANDDTLGGWNQALAVDGMRPDLALIPLPHIYSLDELVRGQRLYGSELFPEARIQRSGQGKDSRRPWLSTPEQVQWIQFWVEQSERPVMWALGEPEFDRFLSPYLALDFPLSRVIGPARDRGSSPPLTERVLQSMQGFHPDNAPGFDRVSSKSFSDQIRMVGREAYRQKSVKEGEALVELALDLYPASYRGWSDLTGIRAALGQPDRALRAAHVSLGIRPDRYAVRGRAMELASSIENWEKVVALGVEFQRWSAPPKAALEAGLLLAEGFMRLERHPEALLHLNTLAESFPDEPRILAYLSQLKR